MKELTLQERKEVLEKAGIEDNENIKIRKYKTNPAEEESLEAIYGGYFDHRKDDFRGNKKFFASHIEKLEKELLGKNSVKKIVNKISSMMAKDGVTKTEIAFAVSPHVLYNYDKPVYYMGDRYYCCTSVSYLTFEFNVKRGIEVEFETKITVVKLHPQDKVLYTVGEYTIKKAIKAFLKNLRTYFKYKFLISYKKYKEQLLKEENEKLKEENEKLKEENEKLKEENKKLKEINRDLSELKEQFGKDALKRRIREAHFTGLFGKANGCIGSYIELKNAFIEALDQMVV